VGAAQLDQSGDLPVRRPRRVGHLLLLHRARALRIEGTAISRSDDRRPGRHATPLQPCELLGGHCPFRYHHRLAGRHHGRHADAEPRQPPAGDEPTKHVHGAAWSIIPGVRPPFRPAYLYGLQQHRKRGSRLLGLEPRKRAHGGSAARRLSRFRSPHRPMERPANVSCAPPSPGR
jgi:hypothetical protein